MEEQTNYDFLPVAIFLGYFAFKFVRLRTYLLAGSITSASSTIGIIVPVWKAITSDAAES